MATVPGIDHDSPGHIEWLSHAGTCSTRCVSRCRSRRLDSLGCSRRDSFGRQTRRCWLCSGWRHITINGSGQVCVVRGVRRWRRRTPTKCRLAWRHPTNNAIKRTRGTDEQGNGPDRAPHCELLRLRALRRTISELLQPQIFLVDATQHGCTLSRGFGSISTGRMLSLWHLRFTASSWQIWCTRVDQGARRPLGQFAQCRAQQNLPPLGGGETNDRRFNRSDCGGVSRVGQASIFRGNGCSARFSLYFSARVLTPRRPLAGCRPHARASPASRRDGGQRSRLLQCVRRWSTSKAGVGGSAPDRGDRAPR